MAKKEGNIVEIQTQETKPEVETVEATPITEEPAGAQVKVKKGMGTGTKIGIGGVVLLAIGGVGLLVKKFLL